MTPVSSQLEHRLSERRLWFTNEWFFKWHHIGGARTIEIDTFDGRKTSYAGLSFSGSAEDVYWSTIARGARKEVIDQFEWIESRVARYERSVAEAAIDECSQLLIGFVNSLRHAAIEKDRILRGDGINFPPRRKAGIWPGTSEAEITQLAIDLKSALFPSQVTAPVAAPIGTTSLRRLSAIFVVDVVGYSLLTGRDEVQTVTRLKTFRSKVLEPLLSKFSGRIFNSGGDSFFLEFNSAVGAIQCWIEALKMLKEHQADLSPDQRFRFRAGIHIGEILLQDGDLLGDTVNIAARLQAIAQPDSLCASASVVNLVAKHIDNLEFIDSGARDLKNIPEPVHVYLAQFSPEQTGNSDAQQESVGIGGPENGQSVPSSVSCLLSVSGNTADLLIALARSCPDGLARKSYKIEDIQRLLPKASELEIQDSVHDLEARGLVKLTKHFGGTWHLRLTFQFYRLVDEPIMGWSTSEDARKIAKQMLADNVGRALTLHQASKWDQRRFNPAFQYVLDCVPPNFVSPERSPDYPASTVLMRPEVQAALRRLTSQDNE